MYNLRPGRGLNRSECNVNAIGKTSDYQPGGSWFNPRPGRGLNRSKCDVNVIGKTSYYQPEVYVQSPTWSLKAFFKQNCTTHKQAKQSFP